MGPTTLERMDYIVAALKNANGEIIPGKDLIDGLGITKAAFYNTMTTVKKAYPNRIKSINSRTRGKEPSGYIWVLPAEKTVSESIFKENEAEAVCTKEPVNKYDEKKTEEGYPDPTAYLAMRMMDNETVRRGEVWKYSATNGVEKVVVLASRGSSVTVIPFYSSIEELHDKEVMKADKVKIARKEVYINCTRITTRPFKYFLEKVGEFSEDEFAVVKAYVALYLGLDGVQTIVKEVPVPVEVEKEVPVRIEVPVDTVIEREVPVEVPTSVTVEGYSEEEVQERIKRAVDAAIMKQKLETYEWVLKKLIDKI